MSTSKAEGKRSLKEAEEEDEDEEDIPAAGMGFGEDDKKIKGRKGSSTGAGSMPPASCQADGCAVDMTIAKRYHRRHKVCEVHANAPFVLVHGIHQRFCQQCSRFHELSEFDSNKKSCRRRLAGHNERRRKNLSDYAEKA